MTKRFYVYTVTLQGDIIYVGKGQGNRCSHVLSGRSHNAKLNEYYYRHTLLGEYCPVVKKVKYFDEEGLALKYESCLIRDLLPECNIRGTKETRPTQKKGNKTFASVKDDDNMVTLPDTYETFLQYAETLYNEVSKGWKKYNTFRTWLTTKKVTAGWSSFHLYIDRYLIETPDARENNGGLNKDGLLGRYFLTEKQVKAYNSFKYRFRKSKQREPSEEECIIKINKLKEKMNE